MSSTDDGNNFGLDYYIFGAAWPIKGPNGEKLLKDVEGNPPMPNGINSVIRDDNRNLVGFVRDFHKILSNTWTGTISDKNDQPVVSIVGHGSGPGFGKAHSP